MPGAPVFFYDFNSPYAYLAASRVDDVLPGAVQWRPIALAFLLRAREREPWSFHEATRAPGVAECERRAAAYGLAPMAWPPGWPIGSYSLASLRAAYVAADQGRLREFSAAAFARNFVDGTGLRTVEDVLAAGEAAGIDPALLRAGLEDPAIKDRLKAATDDAIARGLYGVPTVAVGDELFWGDDQLEAAAAAASAERPAAST